MIRYMPNLDTLLWSLKSIEYFDTAEDLKDYIADQRTRFFRFIGLPGRSFRPDDVSLTSPRHDPVTGWRNCCSVIIDGITVGFCEE